MIVATETALNSAEPSIATGGGEADPTRLAEKRSAGLVTASPNRIGALLAWAIAFGVVHTQSPLFYSNQNQYLLHGLAEGGLGNLRDDWLANTQDPTPAFSALVAVTYRYFPAFLLHAEYFVLLMVYFLSLVAL